jgi:PKD repeat protein
MPTATKRFFHTLVGSLLLALCFATPGSAQNCNRVGWVAALGTCGYEVVDLDSREKLVLTGNLSDLWVGRTFRFGATALPAQPFCGASPLLQLDCLTDTLPTKASFTFRRSTSNHKLYYFKSDVYDANAQVCKWTFSDGAVAQGKEVEHSFAEEGIHTVTLFVKDKWGGEATETQFVEIESEAATYCYFDAHVTVVGNEIQGKLVPLSSPLNYKVESVTWYFHKLQQPVSTSEKMTFLVPGPGSYVIRAEYSIRNQATGELCSTKKSKFITISESNCYAPLGSGILSTICPPTDAPVCGCDGVTYKNECEAAKSGTSSWWIGDCNAVSPCVADLKVSGVSATLTNSGYQITYKNQSSGNFNEVQIDFGDGSPLWKGINWDTVSHLYTTAGVYRVNLTAWNGTECVSSFVKIISTDLYTHNNTHSVAGTDYVMPGDANGDRVANAYDLLNIGVGYFSEGVPRPHASTDWAPQFAPNWGHSVGGVVNYKHLDADGNGVVNVFDTDPIEQYYVPLDKTPLAYQNGLPPIWIKHNLPDTLVIDPLNPGALELVADIMVGTPQQPALDVYGLAFSIDYPEFIKHDPAIDYNDNSFLGPNNHVLTLAQDIPTQHQIDAAFVRSDGNSAGGYGPIASLKMRADFIIIVDIIERTASPGTPLVLPINAVLAIDENGEKRYFSRPIALDSVYVMVASSSLSASTTDWSSRVATYPNPASDRVSIWSKDLKTSRIEAYDALGRMVAAQATNPDQSLHNMDVSAWKTGIYYLRLFTDKGIVEKRLQKM